MAKRKDVSEWEYRWRAGRPTPSIDAQTFGEEVKKLRDELGRPVKPEDLVNEAERDPGVVWRTALDWNNVSAAGNWRIEQARHLLNSLEKIPVKVRFTTSQVPIAVRAFVSATDDRGKRGYLPSEEIVSSQRMSVEVLTAAKRDFASSLRRYSRDLALCKVAIAPVEEFIDAINAAIARLTVTANV